MVPNGSWDPWSSSTETPSQYLGVTPKRIFPVIICVLDGGLHIPGNNKYSKISKHPILKEKKIQSETCDWQKP